MTEEEEAFISGIELGIDWNLDIPPEDIARYKELIEKKKEELKMERFTSYIPRRLTVKGVSVEELENVNANIYAALVRLSEYEDTGLDPSKAAELDDLYLSKCQEVNKLQKLNEELKRQLKSNEAAGRKEGSWEGTCTGSWDGADVYDVWNCSECGYEIDDDTPPDYKYCPECGAKMTRTNPPMLTEEEAAKAAGLPDPGKNVTEEPESASGPEKKTILEAVKDGEPPANDYPQMTVEYVKTHYTNVPEASIGSVAEQLGVTKGTLRSFLMQNGIPIKSRGGARHRRTLI